MKKIHTAQCRWEATKGGFKMLFVSIILGITINNIPHYIHIEPAKHRISTVKVVESVDGYIGKKELL